MSAYHGSSLVAIASYHSTVKIPVACHPLVVNIFLQSSLVVKVSRHSMMMPFSSLHSAPVVTISLGSTLVATACPQASSGEIVSHFSTTEILVSCNSVFVRSTSRRSSLATIVSQGFLNVADSGSWPGGHTVGSKNEIGSGTCERIWSYVAIVTGGSLFFLSNHAGHGGYLSGGWRGNDFHVWISADDGWRQMLRQRAWHLYLYPWA